jgi:hypothetical protein
MSVLNPDYRKEKSVLRKCAFGMIGLLLLSMSATTFAQEFSADLVRQKPAGAAKSKIYVSKGKVRMETEGQSKANYVILNLAQRQSSMVLPDNKTYILSAPGQVPSSIPFFNIENAENACPAWEKSVQRPSTCTKVGDDTVGGRSTVKYTGTAGNGDTGTAWVDRKLRFPIKWEGEKGAAELQNIQEAPQPASLFTIPSDYEKMDVAAARAAKKGKPAPPVRK